MSRTACTEPQCLFKGALHLFLPPNLRTELIRVKFMVDEMARGRLYFSHLIWDGFACSVHWLGHRPDNKGRMFRFPRLDLEIFQTGAESRTAFYLVDIAASFPWSDLPGAWSLLPTVVYHCALGQICWASATDVAVLLLILRCCELYLWSHLLTAVLIEWYLCRELRFCLSSQGKSLHISTRVLHKFSQKEWILTFLVYGSSVSSRHVSTTLYMGFNARVTAIRSSRSMYHG
jgi:hypothetical protein